MGWWLVRQLLKLSLLSAKLTVMISLWLVGQSVRHPKLRR